MSFEDTGAVAEVATADSTPAPVVETPSADPAPSSSPETPFTPQDHDAALRAVWDKHHPPRDNGKFASRQPVDAALAGDQPQATETADSPDAPAQELAIEPAKTPAIDAPNAWSGEMKAKWSSLPSEVQTYVAQREGEAHKAITRAGEKVKAFEPIEQVLQHFDPEFKRHGASPAQGIAGLLNLQRLMDQDRVQGLVQIGATYGIDLRPFFQQQPGQAAEAPRIDPMVQQLQSELSQIKGKLTAKERAEQEAQVSEINSQLAAFAKDKTHFEAVRRAMGALINSGEASTLDEAYDMAVHANPETRKRILEDQRKADEEKRKADQQAKAEQARKAGSINVRGSLAQPSPKSVDDALWSIAEKAWPGARRA